MAKYVTFPSQATFAFALDFNQTRNLKGTKMRANTIIRNILAAIALSIFLFAITAVALLPIDLRMQRRAIKQADHIASTIWTKVSAKPIGTDAYVVQLHSDDPSTPDVKILVVNDDPRGQQLLAMQDGCRIRATRGESQRFRSRSLAYNYLDYSCTAVSGPPPARRG